MSETLREMLIRHEGLRLKPYRCPAGKLTIGVGRNLEDVGISEPEAQVLLAFDIERVRQELSTFQWYSDPAYSRPARKLVLENMCFQLGLPRLLSFKRMIAALEVGDYETTADEMLDSKWAREDSPARAQELAQIMRTGEMP